MDYEIRPPMELLRVLVQPAFKNPQYLLVGYTFRWRTVMACLAGFTLHFVPHCFNVKNASDIPGTVARIQFFGQRRCGLWCPTMLSKSSLHFLSRSLPPIAAVEAKQDVDAIRQNASS